MAARMTLPPFLLPGAPEALHALWKTTKQSGVPSTTLDLVSLRASQINGCASCLDMHARVALKAGETVERLVSVAAWRETPYFTDAERAALALTEAVTRLADRTDPVPDELWDEAAKHYDEKALAGLIVSIGLINIWNRLNVATRQVADPHFSPDWS